MKSALSSNKKAVTDVHGMLRFRRDLFKGPFVFDFDTTIRSHLYKTMSEFGKV